MAGHIESGGARPSVSNRRTSSARVRASDESGQIFLLTGLALVIMIVCVGLVVDVGHAMLVQRQLQAGVDAAALAAAQELPDGPQAIATGEQYSPERAGDSSPNSAAGKNAVNTVDNAPTTVTVLCKENVLPACPSRYVLVNAVEVNARSRVPTWFGRIVGINEMRVSARATACSPCTSKPLDIMVVIDRSTSMRQVTTPPTQQQPNGGQVAWNSGTHALTQLDIHNAREGVKTFLSFFDPALTKVGLALFPPVVEEQYVGHCGNPANDSNPALKGFRPWNGTSNHNVPGNSDDGRHWGYDSFFPEWEASDAEDAPDPGYYTVASLTDDFVVQDEDTGQWGLNPQSALIQRLDCAGAEGSTSYALSIEEAQHELLRNGDGLGRANAQNIIVFMSDGAANTSPTKLPTGHWTNNNSNKLRPCGTGVESAARVKQAGTIIYTIGYDLDGGGSQPERCRRPDDNGHFVAATPSDPNQPGGPEASGAWGTTAYDAIRAMASRDASGQPLFYNKPEPGSLQQIFTQIAMDISNSRARLIDNDDPVVLGN